MRAEPAPLAHALLEDGEFRSLFVRQRGPVRSALEDVLDLADPIVGAVGARPVARGQGGPVPSEEAHHGHQGDRDADAAPPKPWPWGPPRPPALRGDPLSQGGGLLWERDPLQEVRSPGGEERRHGAAAPDAGDSAKEVPGARRRRLAVPLSLVDDRGEEPARVGRPVRCLLADARESVDEPEAEGLPRLDSRDPE